MSDLDALVLQNDGLQRRDRRPAVRAAGATLRFARRKPLGAFGGLIVLLLLVLAVIGGTLAPQNYATSNVANRLHGPSAAHPFGTDEQGRDVLSRVLYGARTSVVIGVGADAIAVAIATVIGVISGYFGRALDLGVQRLVDICQAFPGLVFVIFVVSIFGKSTLLLVIVLGILLSFGGSRIVRGATLAVREQSFIESGRAIGASDTRLLLLHVLPNVLPTIIVMASVQIGSLILLESSLAFLGFGTPPPFPSWGRMLEESRSKMQYHPYLSVFPGLAISATVYGLNMLGDALRDVLDPRLRQ